MLPRTAYLLTGKQHTAGDLVQATLERVWPHWQRVIRNGDPDPYVRRDRTDLSDALRRLLPTLSPRQKAVLVLRYFDDLTEVATAEVLGCSVGTVKSQTSKALDRLRLMNDPRVTEAGR